MDGTTMYKIFSKFSSSCCNSVPYEHQPSLRQCKASKNKIATETEVSCISGKKKCISLLSEACAQPIKHKAGLSFFFEMGIS